MFYLIDAKNKLHEFATVQEAFIVLGLDRLGANELRVPANPQTYEDKGQPL